MQVIHHCPLKDRHTFHIEATALYWADFSNEEELKTLLTDKSFEQLPVFVIGSGSNLLFSHDFDGLLIHSVIMGMHIIHEDDTSVHIRVGSGVEWDDFVAFCVNNGWSGAENLSGIPGKVGATPVQNIGAYGAEAKDLILSVEAFNRQTLEMVSFNGEDCYFGYRDSLFKHAYKDIYVICHVTFRLSKAFNPNIGYGEVAKRMGARGKSTLQSVRQTILEIRHEKLPDPAIQGNAGSFFMNPVIPAEKYQALQKVYPDIPGWISDNNCVKLPAAWCIEKAGWKGRRWGQAGVHDIQPLVLVNCGQATASEVIELAEKVQADVARLFDIELKPEVLFI